MSCNYLLKKFLGKRIQNKPWVTIEIKDYTLCYQRKQLMHEKNISLDYMGRKQTGRCGRR
ncbi:hypothetical protein DPMN_137817 [Dreissena polymorpha]|uniref:Uncharacterized protein n=1 Tax=Dreissena polymorpha TaxID=45954 RepID=A0A9D4JI03_DREPO|nr:hypothetical protein DPMN_137817 [Dreissena polymorpha]